MAPIHSFYWEKIIGVSKMKKIIIITLMVITFNCYSIDYFDLDMGFEIGVMPRGHLKLYEYNTKVYANMSFYGIYNVSARMFDRHLFFGAETKIYIWKKIGGFSFKPDEVDFIFFAGITLFDDSLELGFRHYCQHPILAWLSNKNYYPKWERWFEEIYIKFNFSLF